MSTRQRRANVRALALWARDLPKLPNRLDPLAAFAPVDHVRRPRVIDRLDRGVGGPHAVPLEAMAAGAAPVELHPHGRALAAGRACGNDPLARAVEPMAALLADAWPLDHLGRDVPAARPQAIDGDKNAQDGHSSNERLTHRRPFRASPSCRGRASIIALRRRPVNCFWNFAAAGRRRAARPCLRVSRWVCSSGQLAGSFEKGTRDGRTGLARHWRPLGGGAGARGDSGVQRRRGRADGRLPQPRLRAGHGVVAGLVLGRPERPAAPIPLRRRRTARPFGQALAADHGHGARRLRLRPSAFDGAQGEYALRGELLVPARRHRGRGVHRAVQHAEQAARRPPRPDEAADPDDRQAEQGRAVAPAGRPDPHLQGALRRPARPLPPRHRGRAVGRRHRGAGADAPGGFAGCARPRRPSSNWPRPTTGRSSARRGRRTRCSGSTEPPPTPTPTSSR